MSQRQQHKRTSSHGRKVLPLHGRSSKAPPPLRRGHSYSHTTTAAGPPHSQPLSRKAGAEDVSDLVEEEESGMASFLQFCATCETQIVTPGTNILYCSEACRKKDVYHPPSVESVKSPRGLVNASSYFDHPSADIIPQMSPTRRPWSMSFSELSSSEFNPSVDDGSESERTGWQATETKRYSGELFHTPSTHGGSPHLNRPSTTTDTNIPSLIHSPSSSYGTVASHASYRPQPPRQNPFFTDHHPEAFGHFGPNSTAPSSPSRMPEESSLKSCASTLTSFRVAEAGDISYAKRSPPARESSDPPGSHSFKQLFKHEAVKAPPRAGH